MQLPNLSRNNRSFVSVVFSQTKLQMLKLNASRKQVEKFGEVEIPPGIIVNYKVKDQVALTALVRDAYKKLGFKEKFVGVVIPEFSTYTKILKLPNLSDTEIHEALQWRLQEYLPTPIDEMVYDWKLLYRSPSEVEVLVVAIMHDALFGYIDAVEDSGLLPLVVETPSLSIERLIGNDNLGRMSIYVSPLEALLVVSQGHKIVASLVVTSNKLNDIVNNAVRMLSHYSQANIQDIMVGGMGLTQELIQFLNYNLGRPVKVIQVQIGGMSQAQVQDYLVAVSIQYKNPVEPLSEDTINLLPPDWAKHYKRKHLDIQIWTLSLFSSILVWAIFLSVIIAFILFNQQVLSLKSEKTAVSVQEVNGIVSGVRDINKLASETSAVEDKLLYPQVIINNISSIKPSGINIDDYKISLEDGAVTLQGFAQNRTSLIELQEVLEKNEDYINVDIPLTSLIQESNIRFDISFIYKPAQATAVKKAVKLKL